MYQATFTELPQIPRFGIRELAPEERLRLEPFERSEGAGLSVVDGVMYVSFEDDDVVLTPGDEIDVPPGEPHRIWNAGDDVARVIVTRR